MLHVQLTSLCLHQRQSPAACLQAKKDPNLRTLEARLRNARYLGELVKFRLAPFGTIFVMLKVSGRSTVNC